MLASLHWLSLTFGILPFAIGALSAGSTASIGRVAYAVRLLAVLGALVFSVFALFSLLAQASEGTGDQLPTSDFPFATIMVSAFAVVVLLPFLLGRWSSLRLNHIGWTRWLALLLYVPPANVILLILLCVMPGKETDAAVA